MTVRAKLVFDSYESRIIPQRADSALDWVEKNIEWVERRTLKFLPVSDYGGGDNADSFEVVQSGSISIGVVKPEIWSQFELGQAYYVDFTPAE